MTDLVSSLIRNIWGSEKEEQVKPKSPKKKKKRKKKNKKFDPLTIKNEEEE